MDKTDTILKAIYEEVQLMNLPDNHPVEATSVSAHTGLVQLELLAISYTLLSCNLIEISANKKREPLLSLTTYGLKRAKLLTSTQVLKRA